MSRAASLTLYVLFMLRIYSCFIGYLLYTIIDPDNEAGLFEIVYQVAWTYFITIKGVPLALLIIKRLIK